MVPGTSPGYKATMGPDWVRYSSQKGAAQAAERGAPPRGWGRGATGETRENETERGKSTTTRDHQALRGRGHEGQEGTQQGTAMDREMEGPDHRQRAKGLHVRSANWAHTLVAACRGMWEGNLALC